MSYYKVVTVFTFGQEIMKTNSSRHVSTAILNAVMHLQSNRYSARIAQVSCRETGKLFAVITRNVVGKITILYKDKSVYVEDYARDEQPKPALKVVE